MMEAANDNGRSCEHCGDAIGGLPTKRFCSDRCRRRHGPTRLCEHCGCTFNRKARQDDAAKFCSRNCAFANKREIAIAKEPRPSKPEKQIEPVNCRECGNAFTPVTSKHVLCSDECRAAASRSYAVKSYKANAKVDRSHRPCAECGDVFSPSYGSRRSVYCCEACGRRAAHRASEQRRDKRVKAEGAESVYAIRILDRDRWTCQICGIPTPRDLRGTYEPNAPEVDHIIPLAKGGAHANDNVQCACRACNARKSDRLPLAAA